MGRRGQTLLLLAAFTIAAVAGMKLLRSAMGRLYQNMTLRHAGISGMKS